MWGQGATYKRSFPENFILCSQNLAKLCGFYGRK
jgi:hypothetical protein